MDKFRHIFRNNSTKGLKLKSKTIRDLGLHVHCNMINVTDNYFPNLNTVSMKEVTLTVLALTIRLKAVEITPAEWHVKQWVTLSVCDLIPCPVHCRLHSSYNPKSPSLPTWEPLLTYAVGKRFFFPRLQQKLCTKELTWEPTEREEVKVSDLLLSWLKYCSWHLFSVTAKPKWGSWLGLTKP